MAGSEAGGSFSESPLIGFHCFSSDEDDEDEEEEEEDSQADNSEESEDEEKVLNMAEQFLAALPDRIKESSIIVFFILLLDLYC